MQPRKCTGPATRREFLAAGMLGLGGLALPDLFRLRAAAAESGRKTESDTSIIFIWLPGGPPHIDMYDMKPDASTEIRGAFRPIHTKVPGMELCELMPRHAAIADKFSIVRSVAHDFADHGGGHKRMMTGVVPATPVDTVNDAPCTGSMVAKCRENRDAGIPPYVSLNPGGRVGDVFAQGAAYLGQSYLPLSVQGDPTSPSFTLPAITPQCGNRRPHRRSAEIARIA